MTNGPKVECCIRCGTVSCTNQLTSNSCTLLGGGVSLFILYEYYFINFCRSFLCEHFTEVRIFAQNYTCSLGTTYRLEQIFSMMKLNEKENEIKLILSKRFYDSLNIRPYVQLRLRHFGSDFNHIFRN